MYCLRYMLESIRSGISKQWALFRIHHDSCMVVFTFIGLLGTIIVLFCINTQLHQSVTFNKFDNFKYYNKIYDDWYDDMPKEISVNEKAPFSTLNSDGQAWVRRYFNLYSQEYYLSENKMLPDGMWNGLIHGCKDGKVRAAFRNLQKYPALLEGYFCWKKEEGAFAFPEDFVNMLDRDLETCKVSVTHDLHCNKF